MPKKILVVDDEPNIVKMICSRLAANNYEVIAAYDGVGAVETAHKEKPDLIILDIKMPAGTGVSVYENLRNSANTAIIPVIFITAYPDKDIKKKVLEMGANDFIAKPFKADVMLTKVKEALERQDITGENHGEDIIG
jgi:DNA-binding response OmpR family regulator